MGRSGLRWVGLAVWGTVAVGPLAAQEPPTVRAQLQESQRKLEEIRAERAQLDAELNSLRSQVQDVSGELQNIERQLSASRSVVREVDFQLDAVSSEVTRLSTSLRTTRADLARKKGVLGSRLREVFKRGALNSVKVLLGADSFGDLLNRYRYLFLLTSLDRSLVDRVSLLESSLVSQGRELEGQIAELGRLREARLEEERALLGVQQRRQAALSTYRARATSTEGRLGELQADEARMASTVGALEESRRAAETRTRVAGGPAPEPSTLSTSDVGSLDWPVEGPMIYPFGRQQRPNGTVLRWNGIGIQAPVGTPVRAVRAGLVVVAAPFGGYGPSVVLSHGDGVYTLYLYLDSIDVSEGRAIGEGQVLGTVGGAATPEGPHLEFQVRMLQTGGTTPEATDPMLWLRPR